jgi:hypothetical protein
MRITLGALAIGIGVGVGSAAHAQQVDLPLLDHLISGSAPQSAPALTFLPFNDVMSGTSGTMMLVRGIVGTEFLDALAFNFTGAGTPSFSHLAGPRATTTTFASNAITLGPVGQGGAGFDVLFDYPNDQASRFDGDAGASLYMISGAGVDPSDFNATNASGLFGMAHIGSVGANGEGSAFVAAVPEAEVYAMLLAGLGLLGFVMGRRRRSVVPAI